MSENLKTKFIRIVSDFRFWIIFFFIIRLYGISNPPLEINHNWRQTTGLMVARNFVEIDNNILYPRIDDNEGKEGIVGMEFPMLYYLIYVVSKVFGFEMWYGRLINLIVSTIGIYFFFLLIKKWFNTKLALYSSIMLLSSIWLTFSRKTMSDTFSVALVIISIYYALESLYNYKIRYLLLFIFFSTIGVLSKIPAVYLFAVLIIPFLDKSVELKNKIILSLAFIPMLVSAYWWYYVWDIYLSNTYGTWYNMGNPVFQNIEDISINISQLFEKFYFNSLYSFVGFLLAIAGIVVAIIKKDKKFLLVTGILSFVFALYIVKAGFYFYHHNYYIIPFVPIIVLFAGYTIVSIKINFIRYILIATVIIEGISNQQHDFRIKESEKYKLNLEIIADKVSSRNELIAINGGKNPQQLFLSHRKGWTFDNDKLKDKRFIAELESKNCKFVFVNKLSLDTNSLLISRLQKVYEDINYSVYKLAKI